MTRDKVARLVTFVLFCVILFYFGLYIYLFVIFTMMAGNAVGAEPLLSEETAERRTSPLYELLIERDYSRGVITRFDESFPPCLNGRVTLYIDRFGFIHTRFLWPFFLRRIGGSGAVSSHARTQQPLLPGRRDVDLHAAAGERRRVRVAVRAVLLLRRIAGAADAADGRFHRVGEQIDLRPARRADCEPAVQRQPICM